MPHTNGYYLSRPSYWEEMHGGGLLRGWNTIFFRFYPDGKWISVSRSEKDNTTSSFPFWKFTESLDAASLSEAKESGTGHAENGSIYFFAGTYEASALSIVKARRSWIFPLYPSGQEVGEQLYIWRDDGNCLTAMHGVPGISFDLLFRRV